MRTGLFAGSRFDPPGRQGLAHLCEHLLCQGAWEEQPDLQERIVAAGGTTNGWIYPDRICFGESLPASAFELGLEVVARRLAAPIGRLSSDRLGRERQVLLQERRERETVSLAVETEALHRLLFPAGHPYHRPPGGVADEIAGLTPGDVQGFAERHLVPDRAVLAVIGDLEPEYVARRVEELLGDLEPGSALPPEHEVPPARSGARGELVARVPYARAYLGIRTGGFGDPESLAAAVLVRAMAAGRSSRLRQMLVDDLRLAESVRAYVEEYRDATAAAFVVTAPRAAGAGRLAAALEEAVGRLVAGGLTRADVERGRKMLRIERFNSLSRPSSRADRLTCHALYTGDWGSIDVDDEELRRLDCDAVLAWARRVWTPDHWAVLTVTPGHAA